MIFKDKIILIAGYGYNCFKWHNNVDNNVRLRLGIVFDCGLIVTTRTELIYCDKILIHDTDIELEIIVQSFEWNLIVMTMKKNTKNHVDLLDNLEFENIVYLELKLPNPNPNQNNLEYYLIQYDSNSNKITNTSNLKYIKSTIDKNDYLPSVLNCHFKIENSEIDLNNINGSIVIDENQKIRGIVQCFIRNSIEEILITPTIIIYRILYEWIKYPDEYQGFNNVNLYGTFVKKNAISKKVYILQSPNAYASLALIKINGLNILNRKDVPYVLDPILVAELPLELYLRIRCYSQETVTLTTDDSDIICHLESNKTGLMYTSNSQDFIKINSKHTICYLHYELIQLFLQNYNITLNNQIVMDYKKKRWDKLNNINGPVYILIHTESHALMTANKMLDLNLYLNNTNTNTKNTKNLEHCIPIIKKINSIPMNKFKSILELKRFIDLEKDLDFEMEYFEENIQFAIRKIN